MSVLGTNAAQSTAGLGGAERVEAREKQQAASKAGAKPRRRDEEDHVAVDPEALEAVRNLKDNTQEEAREDRQGKGQYRRDGTLKPKPAPKKLDLQG